MGVEAVSPQHLSPHSRDAQRRAFWEGVRETLTVAPSYIPFAVVCGVASVNAGLSTGAAIALPALVFGGSSQAVATQLMQSAGALWVAVLSGCVVNLRMAVYSAALSGKLRGESVGKRMAVAAFLVDNTFAFLQRRELQKPDDPHWIAYYAGLTAVLWPAWVLFCIVGVFAGNVVPASWQLEFAIPLSFIAICATSIRTLPMAASAAVGGLSSILLFDLPLKLGLVLACLVGLVAGMAAEKGGQLWTARKAG